MCVTFRKRARETAIKREIDRGEWGYQERNDSR